MSLQQTSDVILELRSVIHIHEGTIEEQSQTIERQEDLIESLRHQVQELQSRSDSGRAARMARHQVSFSASRMPSHFLHTTQLSSATCPTPRQQSPRPPSAVPPFASASPIPSPNSSPAANRRTNSQRPLQLVTALGDATAEFVQHNQLPMNLHRSMEMMVTNVVTQQYPVVLEREGVPPELIEGLIEAIYNDVES